MDKLLVNSYGDSTLYNCDENRIKELPYSKQLYMNDVYLATEPGQVITSTEVVDYNAGDIVILIYYYNKENKRVDKVLVSSDPFVVDDVRTLESEIKDETI